MTYYYRAFIFLIFFCGFLPRTIAASAANIPDYSLLLGKWVRTDGGYSINVKSIMTDGEVDASYLNPLSINVSEANVTEWKGLHKLYIKLDDTGYPGSTYTLYYYAEKDALAGFYYQPTINQTFEVIFLRQK